MCRMNESAQGVKSEPVLFNVVGVDPRGYIRLAVGDGLSLESAVARAAGFNARNGHLVATIMPSDTLVDVVSVDADGKFYCVLNPSEPLSPALTLMADYKNTGDDYGAALAPAGMHAPESPIREPEATEATSVDSPACSCHHDSDATQGTQATAESNVDDDSDDDDDRSYRIALTPVNGTKFLAEGVFSRADAEEFIRTWGWPDIVVEMVGESSDDDTDEDDEPDPRNMRVAVMRGDGQIDIVSGLMTHNEAIVESIKYKGIEAIYTVREWDQPTSGTSNAPVHAKRDRDEASEPRVRFRESLVEEFAALATVGDYSKLTSLGLQLALLRHLDHVQEVIIEGKVNCPAHIGMIAASLERFCGQCVEVRTPTRNSNGDCRWDCEEFEEGRSGEITEPTTTDALDYWLDVGLKRDWPWLFEDKEAEVESAEETEPVGA